MLDNFDESILAEHGLAQDIIKRRYGKEVSQNNAKKGIAFIRMHLNFKKQLAGEQPQPTDMEEVVIKGDGSRTTTRMLYLSEEDNQDPKRIMSLMGYDPLQWELISCQSRRNYWDTTLRTGKSTNHAFMIKLSVKPIQNLVTSDYVRQVLADYKRTEVIATYAYAPDGLMLELPLMDLHLGKLAWRDETGQDFDLKIAAQLYRDTVTDLLGKVKALGLRIEKVVFPIGQDFFHVDSTQNTTTAGTALDYDTRWAKMYKKGVELLLWAIEMCRELAPVECMYVPGNHDELLSFCAAVSVECYYKGCDSVNVNTSASARKYVRYGNCLIGYSHGREEGKRIDGLMQIEAPVDWGETLYREWHLGDLHHEAARESGGIIFRRVSTITAIDAWHATKGFVGSIRKAQAFVWDRDKGKVYTIDSVVNSNKDLT